MNFFEQELKKILRHASYGNGATFVGRSAYFDLGNQRQAKVGFITLGTHGQYEALKVEVIGKDTGPIDSSVLRFSESLGTKQIDNPNFRNGLIPRIWTYQGKNEWYAYQPNLADYRLLGKEIEKYADLYFTPEQTMSEQSME